MTDVPTLSNATSSNYAVLNPLDNSAATSGQTITNGNLSVSSSNSVGAYGTMAFGNGKYYWEAVVGSVPSNSFIGMSTGANANRYLYQASNGNKYSDSGGGAAYGASYTTGDIIGVAYDSTTGTLTFYKNNSSQGTAYTGLTGTYLPFILTNGATATAWTVNYGQQPFVYTPPTGFVALNAYNL